MADERPKATDEVEPSIELDSRGLPKMVPPREPSSLEKFGYGLVKVVGVVFLGIFVLGGLIFASCFFR